MEHATQFPEQYSKVASVQKKVRGPAVQACLTASLCMQLRRDGLTHMQCSPGRIGVVRRCRWMRSKTS